MGLKLPKVKLIVFKFGKNLKRTELVISLKIVTRYTYIDLYVRTKI